MPTWAISAPTCLGMSGTGAQTANANTPRRRSDRVVGVFTGSVGVSDRLQSRAAAVRLFEAAGIRSGLKARLGGFGRARERFGLS